MYTGEGGALALASEIVSFKQRPEVLVSGHAYAPEGRPVPSLVARLAVGGREELVSRRRWAAQHARPRVAGLLEEVGFPGDVGVVRVNRFGGDSSFLEQDASRARLQRQLRPRGRVPDLAGHLEAELLRHALHLHVLGQDVGADAGEPLVAADLDEEAEQP